LILGGLHLWFEGFYWYLAPAYFLLTLQSLGSLIFYFFKPMSLKPFYIWGRLLYIIPEILIALGCFFLFFFFPSRGLDTSGPWSVGVKSFEDGSRNFLLFYPLEERGNTISVLSHPQPRFFWENQLLSAKQ